MEYSGKTERCKVRIIAPGGWLADYNGQVCDAIFYEGDINPQIDTEQLKPPIPRWQSAKARDLERVAQEEGEE